MIEVLGNSLEAVGVVECVFGVEWGFDSGVDTGVCHAEGVEVQMLCMRAVECTVLDLFILRLEVCHCAWNPVAAVLANFF